MKRQLSRSKQLRNLAYLCWIAMMLLLAVVTDWVAAWLWFAATCVYLWPAGHYGKRGVS